MCVCAAVCPLGCVPAEMFFSMGPAGMSNSVTSMRSGSELSDSDMESSTQSLASVTQPAALSTQVQPVFSKMPYVYMCCCCRTLLLCSIKSLNS